MPLRIAIRPHFLDHAFLGRAVLPAVEILEILAAAVRDRFPDIAVLEMEGALFPRFLELDPRTTALDAWIECVMLDDGRVRAALETAARSRSGTMGRRLVHGQAVFGGPQGEFVPGEGEGVPPAEAFPVTAERLYRELVPFGPAYRNARDPIVLWTGGAHAVVAAPETGEPPRVLGSPFVLDAALHVASAWCQRHAGAVAFPVGFGRRRVILPVGAGETCRVRVKAGGTSGGSHLFDLTIRDRSGRIREKLADVRMRDVSGGRLKPPSWVRRGVPGSPAEPRGSDGEPSA